MPIDNNFLNLSAVLELKIPCDNGENKIITRLLFLKTHHLPLLLTFFERQDEVLFVQDTCVFFLLKSDLFTACQ